MPVNSGSCPTGHYWPVKQGDTLYQIARMLGTKVSELERLNLRIDPHNLQVGSLLCIPAELPSCASKLYWTVSAGDTFAGIALSTGTTVNRLIELNPAADTLNLQIGQNICLP